MDRLSKINEEEFKLIKNLVRNEFGISLPLDRQESVSTKLANIIEKRKLHSFLEYYQALTTDRSGIFLCELVSSITTSFSYFYREEKNLLFFIDVVFPDLLEELKAHESNDIRIWIAGCAGGEEAYTLAMLMNNYLNNFLHHWDDTILATDISRPALEMAKRGIFPGEIVKNLPDFLKSRYLCPLKDDYVEVVDFIRDKVLFRRLNLARKSFPFQKKFHAIFCRNVMIYLEEKMVEELISKMCYFLKPGGYLFVGASETIDCSKFPLKFISPSIYRRL